MRKIYVSAQGGLGFNIALASFISMIKTEGDAEGNKEYEFNVLSPYFDVFKACPHVKNVYLPPELKDMVLDCRADEGELVLHRLYDMNDFIFKKVNYSEAWAKLMNIPFEDSKNGTKVVSILKPFDAYPALKNQVDNILKAIGGDFTIMQFTGGQTPLVQVPAKLDDKGNPIPNEADWSKVPYNYDNEPLKRHYPIEYVEKFIDLYHNKYPDRKIVIYQLPNEPSVRRDYVLQFTVPYLAYYELAKKAKEVVCIDSSLQHLVAGLVKTTVIWGHSRPESFGYSYNNNVIQKCRTDDLFYFTALGPSGAKIDYVSPEELMRHCNPTLDKKWVKEREEEEA